MLGIKIITSRTYRSLIDEIDGFRKANKSLFFANKQLMVENNSLRGQINEEMRIEQELRTQIRKLNIDLKSLSSKK